MITIIKFDPPVKQSENKDILSIIQVFYPDWRWVNDRGKLIDYLPHDDMSFLIYNYKSLYKDKVVWVPDDGNYLITDLIADLIDKDYEIIDGWEMVDSYRSFDTHAAFESLYEQDDLDNYVPKVGDLLYYYSSDYSELDDFTKDMSYEITEIYVRHSSERGVYSVLRLKNGDHYDDFTIEPDIIGLSYKTWFTPMPKDIRDFDFFGSLQEQEDDGLDWAREVLANTPDIPAPDGNQYLILFNDKQIVTYEVIKNLLELLYELGWSFTSGYFTKGHISSILSYVTKYENGYITLGPSGQMGYGSTKEIFNSANDIDWDYASKIYIGHNNINEQEDDGLDWAREAVANTPDIPAPDGKQHILLFKRKHNEEEISDLIKLLFEMGWHFVKGRKYKGQYNDVISEYSGYDYGFIELNADGRIYYGYGKDILMGAIQGEGNDYITMMDDFIIIGKPININESYTSDDGEHFEYMVGNKVIHKDLGRDRKRYKGTIVLVKKTDYLIKFDGFNQGHDGGGSPFGVDKEMAKFCSSSCYYINKQDPNLELEVDYDQTTKWFESLYEQEDDGLDWAREIVDSTPNLPVPDNKRYILRFKNIPTKEDIINLSNLLQSIGWEWRGDVTLDDNNIRDIIKNRNKSDEAYISLRDDNTMSYGKSPNAYNWSSDVDYNEVPQIWI